jgi:sugar phosphate isomerase/epimerase
LLAIYFQQLAVNEEATMSKRFSFQLYSARNHPPLESVLKTLSNLGYAEVEGFGGVYDAPEKLRADMIHLGLTMPTGHFSIDMMEKQKKKVLQVATTLGVNTLVVPFLMPNERPTSAKGWKNIGKRLEALSRTYRAEGFSVAWHNHDFEFMPLKDGSIPHELMFSAAPTLDWEIDVAWIVRGKSNPLKWIKAYAGAITAAHVKDIAPKGECVDEDGWADVGRGVMKWQTIMDALRQTRCMHYVMEHDKPSDVARFAKRSLASAKKY